MSDEPTLAIPQLRLLLDAIVELGVDRTELCEACGIDEDLLDDPDARVGRSISTELWSQAARRVGRDHLGLRLASAARPRAAGPLAYLLMSSANLREGIERLVAHQAVIDESNAMTLQPEGDGLFLSIGFGTPGHPATAAQVEYRVALLIKYFSWVTDRDVRPREVRFAHPAPPLPSLHERVLACPVRFGAGRNGVLLGPGDLELPSAHANPRLTRAHAAAVARALAALKTRSFSARVRALLVAEIERVPELGVAARTLHVSARTLQRRLAAEGTRYGEIVDSVRRQQCLERLEQGDASIAEIARLGGFSDPSAFYRAFKRWTGCTPRKYRSEHAREG